MKRILSLFLLSWVIMMFSCKEDDFAYDSEIQNKQNISFEELQKKLSGSSVSKRFSIPGIMGKDMTDFEIDTAEIVEINTTSSTTYSMKIVPLDGEDGNLYNLYIYDKNGEIIQDIVKYELAGEEKISAENTEVIYSSKNSAAGCLMLVIAPCEYGYWHDDAHCEGSGWVVVYIGDCGGSGSGGGGGSGDGGGDAGGNDPVTPVGHEPADGSGGGGGGSGGGGNQELSPCELGKKLKTDTAFKNKMQNLKNSAQNDNFEKGFLMEPGVNGSNIYTQVQGSPNDPQISIEIPLGEEYSGLIHSHYNGLLSVFSASDLSTMYSMFLNGNMAQPERNFVMGLVTADSTTYLVVIEDYTKFDNFGQTFFSVPGVYNGLETIYAVTYGITPENTASSNEQNFAKLLKHFNSGLKLMKGNYLNFYGWETVDVDNNNNVTTNYYQ